MGKIVSLTAENRRSRRTPKEWCREFSHGLDDEGLVSIDTVAEYVGKTKTEVRNKAISLAEEYGEDTLYANIAAMAQRPCYGFTEEKSKRGRKKGTRGKKGALEPLEVLEAINGELESVDELETETVGA